MNCNCIEASADIQADTLTKRGICQGEKNQDAESWNLTSYIMKKLNSVCWVENERRAPTERSVQTKTKHAWQNVLLSILFEWHVETVVSVWQGNEGRGRAFIWTKCDIKGFRLSAFWIWGSSNLSWPCWDVIISGDDIWESIEESMWRLTHTLIYAFWCFLKEFVEGKELFPPHVHYPSKKRSNEPVCPHGEALTSLLDWCITLDITLTQLEKMPNESLPLSWQKSQQL